MNAEKYLSQKYTVSGKKIFRLTLSYDSFVSSALVGHLIYDVLVLVYREALNYTLQVW